MSAYEDCQFAPAEFSGVVRLFPIPNLVLFPHVMQPLHVFEPRYCDLLEDALRGDRFITTAVLAPGWEADYDGRPRVRSFACLGRVAVSRPLEDGTHNLLLLGLRRVRLLNELPPRKPYREAMAMVCEDIYPPNQAQQRGTLRRELHERLTGSLPRFPEVREQLGHLLNSTVSLAVLTDLLGYTLNLRFSDRETLLAEVNVHRRAELLLERLATAEHDYGRGCSSLAGFPPKFSPN